MLTIRWGRRIKEWKNQQNTPFQQKHIWNMLLLTGGAASVMVCKMGGMIPAETTKFLSCSPSPAIFPSAQAACSLIFILGTLRSSIRIGTTPASIMEQKYICLEKN